MPSDPTKGNDSATTLIPLRENCDGQEDASGKKTRHPQQTAEHRKEWKKEKGEDIYAFPAGAVGNPRETC